MSPAFEYLADAEQRIQELLEKEEYQGKNLAVRQASYPVDPRKPARRRKK
jgi:hypothetical protein